jgi:transcriptional accessory protein Tex/SPT6
MAGAGSQAVTRARLQVARFNDRVDDIKDLREGMELEGTVKCGCLWCVY